MKTPALHPDEANRLKTLDRIQILDTPAEERFDRVTRLAKRLFDSDIALVSLVDGDRQWFKSAQGLGATETSRDISFCGHAILGEDVFVIEDARNDERFVDNPLVTGDPNIRFYAGRPIRAQNGLPMGTLCVIDSAPRKPTPDDLLLLDDLARLVEAELTIDALRDEKAQLRSSLRDTQKRAAVDGLTRLWNREMVLELLGGLLTQVARGSTGAGVALIDLDHFKSVNDNHGHLVGDEVLRGAAQRMKGALRPSDFMGRYGGEEFLAIFPASTAADAHTVCERLRARLAAAPVADLDVTASVGFTYCSAGEKHTLEEVLQQADAHMYEAKAAGRDRVVGGPLDSAGT